MTGGDQTHPIFIRLAGALALLFRFEGGTLTLTGQPGDNFVPVTGPFDAATRSARLTGSGVVAGRPNVGVALELQFPDANAAMGSYVMGLGGGLPGGTTTTYGLQCRR